KTGIFCRVVPGYRSSPNNSKAVPGGYWGVTHSISRIPNEKEKTPLSQKGTVGVPVLRLGSGSRQRRAEPKGGGVPPVHALARLAKSILAHQYHLWNAFISKLPNFFSTKKSTTGICCR